MAFSNRWGYPTETPTRSFEVAQAVYRTLRKQLVVQVFVQKPNPNKQDETLALALRQDQNDFVTACQGADSRHKLVAKSEMPGPHRLPSCFWNLSGLSGR